MKEQMKAIEFAGDNPCIVLYDSNRNVASAISYWHSSASLGGLGGVLFVLQSSPERTLEASIFSDNADLAAFLRTFNKHFEGFGGVNLDVAIQPATFRVRRELQSARLECASTTTTITADWTELSTTQLVRSDVMNFGGQIGRSYEVSSVIVSAHSGAIVVNGERQPGHVIDGYGALPKSAFLAFCETWIRLESDGQ